MPRSFAILLILVLFSIKSQAQYKDGRLWTMLALEKKVFSHTTLHLNGSVRMIENYTRVGTAFAELGIEIRLLKTFRIAGYYRFGKINNLDDSYSTRHRFYVDFSIRKKFLNFFALTARVRYQSQYEDYSTSARGHIPSNTLRYRFTTAFDLNRRYAPYLSVELFHRLNRPIEESLFNTVRYRGGFNYEINKRNGLELYYMLIREFNVSNPGSFYVTGITYSIKL